MPPIRALIVAIKIRNRGYELRIKAKMIRGANFCQVASNIQDIHDMEVITDGNQKWKGAIPSFSKIAHVKIRLMW